MKINFRKIQVLLTLLGMIGIAALFLPFSWGTSPLKALFIQNLWLIAAPFFLVVPVSYASIRMIFSGELPKVEKVIIFIISAASACLTICFLFLSILSDWPPTDLLLLFGCIVSLVILFSGTRLLMSRLKQPEARAFCPLISLQVAYLANCLMCLIIFCSALFSSLFTGWEIGAWFSLATAVIYLLQIYLTRKQRKELNTHDLKGSILEKTNNVGRNLSE